jgi:integrase
MTIKAAYQRRGAGPRNAAELEAVGRRYIPTGTEGPAKPAKAISGGASAKPHHAKLDLSRTVDVDARIDIARDDGRVVILHDQGGKRSVPGLSLRIGPRSATWYHDIDKIDHGHRVVKREKLGEYDRGTRDENPIRAPWHVDIEAARNAATFKGAAYIKGEVPDGSITFGDAFATYLDKLQAKADNNGKIARWRGNVKNLGDGQLLPRWRDFPLSEMSRKRAVVGAWYNSIAKDTPSTAHHLRSTIRAVYNWARKAGADLPADNPATMPIERKQAYKTKAGRKALPRVNLDQFPAWLAEWRRVADPMQRAYWLFLLFSGLRPGEALRAEWAGLDEKHGTLAAVENAKEENDIIIPLSDPIRRVLDLARAAGGNDSGLIFYGPNADQWSHREPPMSVPGHGLRRTFKTVGASLGFPNEMTGRLLGHQPEGVSANYEDPLAVQRAAFLSEMQAKVSAAVIQLLGSDPTLEKIAAAAPSARDVARAAGAEQYKSDQTCTAGHVAPLRYVATNRCCQCVTARNVRQKANRARSRKPRRAA